MPIEWMPGTSSTARLRLAVGHVELRRNIAVARRHRVRRFDGDRSRVLVGVGLGTATEVGRAYDQRGGSHVGSRHEDHHETDDQEDRRDCQKTTRHREGILPVRLIVRIHLLMKKTGYCDRWAVWRRQGHDFPNAVGDARLPAHRHRCHVSRGRLEGAPRAYLPGR